MPAAQIIEAADAIAAAGTAFSTHSWRAAAAGHLWGWQITRCLYLLVVLMGAIGEPGGVNLHATNKFVPKHPNPPPPPDYWNELLFPKEFPLAFFEMSFLLPHFLKEGRGKLDTYFTRVYNPLWTNPDGFTWMEVLQDESKIGMHVALTPIWSETAWFADYVLPMGLGTERHDTMSQETHAGRWLGFRQPVKRVAMEKRGDRSTHTHEANPGEVWEEAEFWIALSWKIDPDGSLGIRKFFESPYRPGEKITVDEYYGWMFENSVPGLPEAAAKEGLTPLQYMRKYGVFKVDDVAYSKAHEQPVETGGDRRRRRPARRIQHAVTQARVLLADARGVGLAGTRDSPLRPGPRLLARSRSRRERIRSAAELPAADADPHAIAREVALRDLAQQSAVDRDRRRGQARRRAGRSREGDDRHRPLRDARLGHRRHPARRRRHVAPPWPVAAERRSRRRARRRRRS